jgi:hypothetical protein
MKIILSGLQGMVTVKDQSTANASKLQGIYMVDEDER